MNDQAAPRQLDSSDASVALENCSHCGFPLNRNSAGLRHYGTHTAHQESECLRMLHAEIARLKNAVRLARADEMYRWSSRVDALNAQLRASDARYMALLKSVTDSTAMLPRTVVLVNGAAEDFPPQCERAPT
jgi:hypothetical protein